MNQNPNQPQSKSSVRTVAWLLFLAFMLFYILCARGRITSGDEWHVFGTTESLVERGSFKLDVDGLNGREFSRYSPLPSLLGVPFYWIGAQLEPVLLNAQLLEGPSRTPAGTAWTIATTGMESCLTTSLTVALLFWGMTQLTQDSRSSFAVAVIYGIATPALPYCSTLYGQPLTALAVTATFFGAVLGRRVLLSLSLVILLLLRLEYIVIVPPIALFLLKTGAPKRDVAVLAVLSIIGVCGQFGINYLKGDPILVSSYGTEGFTTSFWVGIHGLIFSTGKGLLWISPICIVAIASLPGFVTRYRDAGMLLSAIVVFVFILTACWWTWHGAISWGPRLLVPILPLLMVSLSPVMSAWHESATWCRLSILGAVLVSTGIQMRGVLADPIGNRSVIGENESIYIPQTSPLAQSPEGFPDLMWLRLFPSSTVLIVVAATLMIGIVSIIFLAGRTAGLRWNQVRAVIPALSQPTRWALVVLCLAIVTPQLVVAFSSGEGLGELIARGGARQGVKAELYAPLSGTYTVYGIGNPPPELNMGGRTVVLTEPVLVELEKGYHEATVRANESCRILWTTPGNAHYKEPIPAAYLDTVRHPISNFVLEYAWSFWLAGIFSAGALMWTKPE